MKSASVKFERKTPYFAFCLKLVSLIGLLCFPSIIKAQENESIPKSSQDIKMEIENSNPSDSQDSGQESNLEDDDEAVERFVRDTDNEIFDAQPSGDKLLLNLEDCLKMAVLNNKEVKATDYAIENMEWKLKEAQPRGSPTFEYKFDAAPAPRDADRAIGSFFDGDITYLQRGSITMAIPVFTFGKLSLAQDLAKVGISAEKEKQVQKKNEVLSKVKKLYFGILLAKDLKELLQDADNQLEKEIERRSEDPQGNPVEVVRMKLYRYEVLSRLSEVEKKGYLAMEGLRIMMGLRPGTNFELNDRHLKPVDFELKDFEYYNHIAKKFRPKSRLVDMGLQAKALQYRLEKRKAAPDIGVGAGFEFGRTTNEVENIAFDDDFNDPFNYTRAFLGVRVKGEIGPKTYIAKTRQARAEYFKVAMEKQAADEGLELDLKEAYLSVQQGEKNVKNSKMALKTARQFVFITKSSQELGVGNEKDYSDALQTYMLSRGRYLEAVFSYNSAVATLVEKMGGVSVKD